MCKKNNKETEKRKRKKILYGGDCLCLTNIRTSPNKACSKWSLSTRLGSFSLSTIISF